MAAVLEQTEEVKQKVEAVVDDLSSTNRDVKNRLDVGKKTLPAARALADGQRVESAVKEVSDDLHEVNDALSQGITQIKETEIALVHAQNALEQTEENLVAAQHNEHAALQRALHDSATGLPNRELFDDRLEHAIASAERHSWSLAVMFIDLDRFKEVNDNHGHAAGDRVLKEAARRLAQHSRDEDTVCRNGGDEFLILLVNPQGSKNVERIAKAIGDSLAEPMNVGNAEVAIGASIGIAFFPEHGRSNAQLIERADSAMYRAKKSGARYAIWE